MLAWGCHLMERFFLKKLELWLVGLLIVFGLGCTILFGAMVKNVALGYDRFGKLGAWSFALASVPADAQKILRGGADNWMQLPESNRFEGRAGFRFAADNPDAGPDGFLLLSRYDGNIQRHVVELLDLSSGEIDFRVELDTDRYFEGVAFDKDNALATPWNPNRFRAIHPIATTNGDLLIKDHSGPLARVSPCGELVWLLADGDYHHSINAAPEGGYWIPTRVPLENLDRMVSEFSNPGLARISEEGEILYQRSLGNIIMENGLEHLILSVADTFEHNRMHLNDIQPVASDGPFWKRADAFLSLPAISTIILFRPSTDQIIWMKQGPWLAQHDVDIVNEHTIAVFNNDTVNLGSGPFVRGANKVTYYDFATDKTHSPHDATLIRHEVRTKFGGLFERLPKDHLMVEETGGGRLAITDANGDLFAEYVNRAQDGKLYHLGWSRYLGQTEGEDTRDAMLAADCR
mgnify:CR=1 FL=1